MLILLRLAVLFITYIFFFRDNFLSELAISFVPYIVAFCGLAMITEIILIIKESRRRRKNKTIRLFFTIIVTILTIGIGTLYSSEFFGFYNQPDESIRLDNNENGIKVFYANILFENTDYESLKNKIIDENPDIVIMVEFSDAHEDIMRDFFKENYPYMNRNSRSTMLAGDVVFSKIPLKNFKTTGIEGKGARKYSYTQIDCDNSELNCLNDIDLYIIHTAAPVSLENFNMRNKQLEQLGKDFTSKSEILNPTIVIGDFNLSPWSYYYKQLIKHWNLLNALSFQSPNYTWSLLQQGIFRSHIDQLFISLDIKISKVNIENLTGSDHRSFSFMFGIK